VPIAKLFGRPVIEVVGPRAGFVALAIRARTPLSQAIITISPTLKPATLGDADVVEQLSGIRPSPCTVTPEAVNEVMGPAWFSDGGVVVAADSAA
jgi:hypothetical protein